MADMNSYYEELQKFIEQSKTGNLKTKHFFDSFLEIKVKVGFGQGTPTNVPWISFLIPPNTPSHGIYPVYLLYKDKNILVLAYGISETNTPIMKWNNENPVTIFDYFDKNSLGKPNKYGDSYVHRVYSLDKFPNSETLDNDLKEIIGEYKKLMDSYKLNNEMIVEPEKTKKKSNESMFNLFHTDLLECGLLFSNKLVSRLISSLISKPFVILTGLSGSGKTKLAQSLALWISQNKHQYCIVPVGADWTNREPLLGYPNAINPAEYVKPDNGVLDLIIDANRIPNLPFFLILDEMNLSHVERYFADFLSVMETKDEISLHSVNEIKGIPAKLPLPKNLFIIGTVNIDETTYMFSPKVLDRANTIEFRVSKDEMDLFFKNVSNVDLSKLAGKGASMASNFLELCNNNSNGFELALETKNTLIDFFEQLKKIGAEFGYRSAAEIINLIDKLTIIAPELGINEKIDIAIMQKLLPKLHGSRRKLCPILLKIGTFCLTNKIERIEAQVFEAEEFNFNDPENVKYPLSLEKITRMYNGAVDNGFASYAEA